MNSALEELRLLFDTFQGLEVAHKAGTSSSYLESVNDGTVNAMASFLSRNASCFHVARSKNREDLILWVSPKAEQVASDVLKNVQRAANALKDYLDKLFIPADSCLAVAAYLRKLLLARGRSWGKDGQLILMRPSDRNSFDRNVAAPEWFGFCLDFDLGVMKCFMDEIGRKFDIELPGLTPSVVEPPPGWFESQVIAHDGEIPDTLVDDYLFSVNCEAAYEWLGSCRTEWLKAAKRRREVPAFWEATFSDLRMWPDTPILDRDTLRMWLTDQVNHISESTGEKRAAENCFTTAQMLLRNVERVMRSIKLPVPCGFKPNPETLGEAEKQFEVLLDALSLATVGGENPAGEVSVDTGLRSEEITPDSRGRKFALATEAVPEEYHEQGLPCGPLEGNRTRMARAVTGNPKAKPSDLEKHHRGKIFVREILDRKVEVFFRSFREFHAASKRLTSPNGG